MTSSRNYNVNRVLDGETDSFENELNSLLMKYGAEMETETFDEGCGSEING